MPGPGRDMASTVMRIERVGPAGTGSGCGSPSGPTSDSTLPASVVIRMRDGYSVRPAVNANVVPRRSFAVSRSTCNHWPTAPVKSALNHDDEELASTAAYGPLAGERLNGAVTSAPDDDAVTPAMPV